MHEIIIRSDTISTKDLTRLQVFFEFVLFIKIGKQNVKETSCGWCVLPIKELDPKIQKPKNHLLNI